jgi:hypothetical protein
MSRGFMFSGFYTLSKALDELLDQGAGLTAGVANPFDLDVMKGRSQFDRRHVVGISWMWEQSRAFNNPVVGALLGGWTVSGVHNWSSGTPLNFVMGTDVALDGTNGAGRQLAQLAAGASADDIKRDHGSRDEMIAQFFNTNAFMPVSQVPRGSYGDVPKGAISGPALAKTDLAVARSFRLAGGDGLRLQLRGELFNAFDQVNFDNPITTASAATFGRLTSADPGRIGQVAVKLIW